jgi:hypothetical protein
MGANYHRKPLMSSTPSDPVAALAALDADAVAEATTAGLLAGEFKSDETCADAVLIRYLEHSLALARALPARDLLKTHATTETLFDRLRVDDGDDFLEECVDKLVMTVVGRVESEDVPDEATTEAAVLSIEHIIEVAANHLYRGVLKVRRARQN